MVVKFAQKGLVLAGLGLLLLAAPLRAEDGKECWDGRGGQEPEAQMLHRMKKELKLTSDQVDQVKQTDKADEATCKPFRDKLKLDVDSLRVLVDKKASDADLKTAIALIRDDVKAVKDSKSKHFDGIFDILTPSQQAKEVFIISKHMQLEKKKHRGGHDGNKADHKEDVPAPDAGASTGDAKAAN